MHTVRQSTDAGGARALNPEAHGQPAEKGIQRAPSPAQTDRAKEWSSFKYKSFGRCLILV